MSTSKEQSVVNNLIEIKWALAYYLHMDSDNINVFLNCGNNLRNYWLQKKEFKERDKIREAKIEKIAKFVTKYISGRKQ